MKDQEEVAEEEEVGSRVGDDKTLGIDEYCQQIFYGEKLEDKLFCPSGIDYSLSSNKTFDFLTPGRSPKIQFSNKKEKFPKRAHFSDKHAAAKALHFFANHELLAIEIMASMVLKVRDQTPEVIQWKKDVIETIADEQNHFQLYVNRMKELGHDFGDFSINDFFWIYAQKIKTIEEYSVLIALTFESANLDFSRYYAKAFQEVGDVKTADILMKVYQDEIKHVAFGHKWIKKRQGNQDLWKFFCESLPKPLTASRAKGLEYDFEARKKAGLPSDFIQAVYDYKDDYRITTRKK